MAIYQKIGQLIGLALLGYLSKRVLGHTEGTIESQNPMEYQ